MTRARLPGAMLLFLALGSLVAGCGSGSSPAASAPVALPTAGWPALASDVDLAALRHGFPTTGDCVLGVSNRTPKALELQGCGGSRGGLITTGRPARRAVCHKLAERTRCSASDGLAVSVWGPRAPAAIALLKATIEAVDETLPDDAVNWGMWPEPNLEEPKGSLSLAPPRHVNQAIVTPCRAAAGAAAMLATLTVSKRTARHVAGRGVHIRMVEKPSATRDFSMAINDECRRGTAGVLRGAAIDPPPSRVERFVLVIPHYYSAGHRQGQRALLRGLLLEPKLYRGEKHNQLPETMLAEPEDPEAGAGQIPLIDSAPSGG